MRWAGKVPDPELRDPKVFSFLADNAGVGLRTAGRSVLAKTSFVSPVCRDENGGKRDVAARAGLGKRLREQSWKVDECLVLRGIVRFFRSSVLMVKWRLFD
jgi:hypothetical protein